MIVKQVFQEEEGRKHLKEGIRIISDAVSSTLGPMGRTVLLEDESIVGSIHATKDGITVAKSINLEHPVQNMAVSLIRQASNKTAIAAGDGSSTSTLLTDAIIRAAEDNIDDKNNLTEVLRHINKLSAKLDTELSRRSKKVEGSKLNNVASISANNDKYLGDLVAKVYNKASFVTVENSMTTETYSEVVEGIKINRGFSSKFFITDHKKNEAILENAYVLITDQEINTLESIEPVLAFCVQNNKPLFIVGELAPAVLNTLNMNVIQKRIKFGNCIPPAMGYRKEELLTDLAIALGAKYYSERTGDILTSISVDGLGKAKKVVISQENTVIIRDEYNEESNLELDDHIKQLKESVQLQNNPQAIDFLNERISNISGGIGIIYVGANTDIEQKELKDRLEDSVLAVRAALEEGILPGGGIALIQSCSILKDTDDYDEQTAVDILIQALQEPFKKILINAGKDPIKIGVEIANVNKPNYGYDCKNEKFGDMIKMGIIDPAKVTKSALKNAVSVATTILSTSTIISNIRA